MFQATEPKLFSERPLCSSTFVEGAFHSSRIKKRTTNRARPDAGLAEPHHPAEGFSAVIGLVSALVPLARFDAEEPVGRRTAKLGRRLLDKLRLRRAFKHAVIVTQPNECVSAEAERTPLDVSP
jgi:hypothetical protein